MRKRGEAAAAFAATPVAAQQDPRQQTLEQQVTRQDAPAPVAAVAVPTGGVDPPFELFRGKLFAECPHCGLKQSAGAAKSSEGVLYCMKCNGAIGRPPAVGAVPAAAARPNITTGAALPINTRAPGGGVANPVHANGAENVAAQHPVAHVSPLLSLDRVDPGRACLKCGAVLADTAVGQFHSCGHGTEKVRGDDAKSLKVDEAMRDVPPIKTEVHALKPHPSPGGIAHPGGVVPVGPPQTIKIAPNPSECVSATWGEEMIRPEEYNHFKVGPVAGDTSLRAGETHAKAALRLYEELEVAGEEMRRRKTESFLKALAQLKGGGRK